MGMPLDVFVEKTWEQLVTGSDHVIVGAMDDAFIPMVKQRRDRYEGFSNLMLAHFEL